MSISPPPCLPIDEEEDGFEAESSNGPIKVIGLDNSDVDSFHISPPDVSAHDAAKGDDQPQSSRSRTSEDVDDALNQSFGVSLSEHSDDSASRDLQPPVSVNGCFEAHKDQIICEGLKKYCADDPQTLPGNILDPPASESCQNRAEDFDSGGELINDGMEKDFASFNSSVPELPEFHVAISDLPLPTNELIEKVDEAEDNLVESAMSNENDAFTSTADIAASQVDNEPDLDDDFGDFADFDSFNQAADLDMPDDGVEDGRCGNSDNFGTADENPEDFDYETEVHETSSAFNQMEAIMAPKVDFDTASAVFEGTTADIGDSNWAAFGDDEPSVSGLGVGGGDDDDSGFDWSAGDQDYAMTPAPPIVASPADVEMAKKAPLPQLSSLSCPYETLGDWYPDSALDEEASSSGETEAEKANLDGKSVSVQDLNALVREEAENLNEPVDISLESAENADDSIDCIIWPDLRSVEDTVALLYQWPKSQSQEYYFDSLSLDPTVLRLKNPNLPAFAWHLGITGGGILTPQKPADPSGLDTLTPTCGGSSVSAPMATTTMPSAANDSAAAKPTVNNASNNNSTIPDSLCVDPAEFDWGSTDLKNPLAQGNAALLDLDTLALLKESPTKTGSALRQQLEQLGLADVDIEPSKQNGDSSILGKAPTSKSSPHSQPSGGPSKNNQPPKSSSTPTTLPMANGNVILNNLLKGSGISLSSAQTASSGSEELILRPEVAKVLQSVPDLSFMLSPVLMFPIRDEFNGGN